MYMKSRYFTINSEKRSIRCKLYGPDAGTISRVILFCHGFGGHKDNRAAEKFAVRVIGKNRETGVIVFDWPCHGEDARKNLQLDDCDLYLKTVLGYIREHFGTDRIWNYSTSFGGYLVLKYIHEHGNPFVKIALRCPAVNMYDSITGTIMTPEEYRQIMSGKGVLVGFDRKVEIRREFLEELQKEDIRLFDYMDHADDILVIHGSKDEIIPVEASEAFCENNVIELERIENADHRFTDPKTMERAITAILRFFDMR